MTVTIHVPAEQEADLRDAYARGDWERLRRLLGDLADRVIFEDDPLERELQRVRDETPEERARRVAEARTRLRPGQSPAKGKGLDETLFGRWPGTETDEEVRAALDRLS